METVILLALTVVAVGCLLAGATLYLLHRALLAWWMLVPHEDPVARLSR